MNTFDLVLLCVGAIIGTGIFVLTGTGTVKVGQGLMISFLITALCYAEFASMVPISRSTYTYTTIGEIFAFIIGRDLALEYMLGVSTISVGWSGYFQSLLVGLGIHTPDQFTAPPGVFTVNNIMVLLTLL